MLPHSYKDLFSYLFWRGHFWHPIWIFCCISPALWRFLPKSPEAGDFSPVSPFSPLHAGRFLPKSPISPKSLASKGPLLASNSNRQRLAIFCQFCHFHHCMHGEFRQNRHFRQNRQPPRGHFWRSIQIASSWRFFATFAIFAIACISGHKCVRLMNPSTLFALFAHLLACILHDRFEVI